MSGKNLQANLSHRAKRKGVLVPLLEDLFSGPVEPEDEMDVEFISNLVRLQILRQMERGNTPMFSPSQLASCLRLVYLLKNHEQHGITKLGQTRLQPNYYFFNGNWLHLKWQFALFKLGRKFPNEFQLIGCEVPVRSKHGDHGGTIDALGLVHGKPYVIDFKGLNVRDFGKIARGDIPIQYVIQLADYGMLFNSALLRKNASELKIQTGLLITENKGGPDPKHPIALHESHVEIELHLPQVRLSLEALREADGTIPAPECVSPHSLQFGGCPFRGFCKDEVTAIYKRTKEAQAREELKLSRPKR